MATEHGDSKVLSYHDVLLRKADVELLRGPYWLNDQVIAFYMEYLMREALPPPASDTVLMLPAATTFLLLHADAAMATALLEPLMLRSKGLVLCAVNDNPCVDMAGGGSHWSLLAYHAPSHTLRHYDSQQGANARMAQHLGATVRPLLGEGGSSSGAAPAYMEVAVPPQRNGYDCGVYVLALAEALARWHCQGADIAAEEAGLGSWLTPEHVAALRTDVLRLIDGKAAA